MSWKRRVIVCQSQCSPHRIAPSGILSLSNGKYMELRITVWVGTVLSYKWVCLLTISSSGKPRYRAMHRKILSQRLWHAFLAWSKASLNPGTSWGKYDSSLLSMCPVTSKNSLNSVASGLLSFSLHKKVWKIITLSDYTS